MMVLLLLHHAQPLAKRRVWGLSSISFLGYQKLAVSLGRSQCDFLSQQGTTKKAELRPLLDLSWPVLVE